MSNEIMTANMEKVIKGLECCLKESDHLYSNPCNGCPYEGQECVDRMKADALVLLKEQEAVEPRRIDGKRNHSIKCGNCNYDLLTGYMFCPHCGRAVKWE